MRDPWDRTDLNKRTKKRQAKALPLALKGKDIIAKARTGSLPPSLSSSLASSLLTSLPLSPSLCLFPFNPSLAQSFHPLAPSLPLAPLESYLTQCIY